MSFASAIRSGLAVEVEAPSRMIVRGLDGLALVNPDGTRNYIKLHSSASAAAREFGRRRTSERLAAATAGRRSLDEVEADNLDLLVALTAEWGTIDAAGAEAPDPEFSAAAVRAVYADPANAALLSQVEAFVGALGNFKRASSPS